MKAKVLNKKLAELTDEELAEVSGGTEASGVIVTNALPPDNKGGIDPNLGELNIANPNNYTAQVSENTTNPDRPLER